MTAPYYTGHYGRPISYPERAISSSHTPAHPPWAGLAHDPTYFPPPPPYSPYARHPYDHAGPSQSRGRDYLLSLQTGMKNLALSPVHPEPPRQRSVPVDKPLPQLPLPPPMPARPYSLPDRIPAHHNGFPLPSQYPRERPGIVGRSDFPARPYYPPPHRPHTIADASATPPPCTESRSQPLAPIPPAVQVHRPKSSAPITPPKAFRPSTNIFSPCKHPPSSEPRLSRPHSELIVPTTPAHQSRNKNHSKTPRRVSVVIIDSDSDTPSDTPECVTIRSPARRKRATSERPPRTIQAPASHPLTAHPIATTGAAVKCAGFTRKGAPCQRTVKAAAPFLAVTSEDASSEGIGARYCTTHAGMICSAKGFYWRSHKEDPGVWVEFADFIPNDLGQQTQALTRMTMESPLTEKETPGFLYAYELRDLEDDTTCFFKVGRTDNVPRRIGEWTTRCRSHTPTLRDIFPLPSPSTPQTGLHRNPTLPTSYLPGALKQMSNPNRTCPNVKRWERLVHLELGDLALRHAPEAYEALKVKCGECQARHREIFPLGKGDGVYRERVMEVICRWERFIRKISDPTRRSPLCLTT